MFETEIIEGIPVIQGVNTHKINALNSDELKEVVSMNLSINDAIIINFNEIRYIDSTGFGTLLAIYDQATKAQKRMVLVNISSEVGGLFKITKLDQVFEILATLPDALKTFN